MEKEQNRSARGITLVALIVTLIILLILAGITITMLFGEHGVIKKAQTSNEKYKIAKAREKLELVLNTDAALEKRINPKYNQDDFLDKLITAKVTNSKVIDNMAIVDGYVFELDRSVPKIGEYIGKEDNLKYPSLQVAATLESDYKSSTITINAEENTNGIKKIEVIQGGFVIKEYTYDNKKEAITENFNVTQNGEYIVKVYSKLPTEQIVEVKGIIMSIEYAPNGNETYKKEHQVIVRAKENGERVKSIKYQWLESTEKPEKETFTEELTNGEQITKNEITGTWYLWTLLETESGSYSIQRSDAFNFDNKGPNVTLTSTPISATSFTLNAEASDEHIGGELRYEFYIGGVSQNNTPTAKSYTKNYISTGYSNCSVKVYDSLNNVTEVSTSARTMLYKWNYYKYTVYNHYEKGEINNSEHIEIHYSTSVHSFYDKIVFSEEKGWTATRAAQVVHGSLLPFGFYVQVRCSSFGGGSGVSYDFFKVESVKERIENYNEDGTKVVYTGTLYKSIYKSENKRTGSPVKTSTSTSISAHTSGTIEDGYLVEYAGLT